MRSTVRRLLGLFSLSLVALAQAACGFGEPAAEDALPETFGMFPLSSTSADVQAEVVRVHRALDMSRVREANEHAQAIIALDPMYGYGYLLAAWTARSAADYRANLRRAIENSAGANDVERAMIEAEQRSFDADPEGALAIEQELLATDPSNPLFHWIVALRLENLARVEESRAAAQRAIELAPDYAGAISWLGISYTHQQPSDYARAEELLMRAVELEPDEPYMHDYLADLHRQDGRLAEAVEGYTRSLELSPERAGAFLGQRGHAYSFMEDFAAARRDYLAAAEAAVTNDEGGSPAWWTRQAANTHIYEGDIQAAGRELEHALAILDTSSLASADDETRGLLVDVILFHGHNGNVAPARAALDRLAPLARANAVEIGTDVARRNTERNIAIAEGMLAMWSGDYALARTLARDAMAHVADLPNPRRNEGSHALLGMTSLREGRYDEAIGHFRQTADADLYTVYHHALALDRAGRTGDARALYDRVANHRFSYLGIALVKHAAQQRLAELDAAP